MNLQPINPALSRERGTQFRFVCRGCEKVKMADECTRADLDGTNFGAFYCGDCVCTKS